MSTTGTKATTASAGDADVGNEVRHGSFIGRSFERLGMLPVLVVMYLLFYGLTIYFSDDGTSNFLTQSNNMNILRQVAINLVLACGMTFVILTAGIDLSVGSMLAVSAVLGMTMSLPDWMPWASLPTFILAGLLCGLINGLFVAYFNMNPFVITLGTMTALRGAAYLLANGTTVLNNDIPSFDWLGNGDFLAVPWLIWVAAAVAITSWFILRKTILGLSSFWQYVSMGVLFVLAVLLDKWRQHHSYSYASAE